MGERRGKSFFTLSDDKLRHLWPPEQKSTSNAAIWIQVRQLVEPDNKAWKTAPRKPLECNGFQALFLPPQNYTVQERTERKCFVIAIFPPVSHGAWDTSVSCRCNTSDLVRTNNVFFTGHSGALDRNWETWHPKCQQGKGHEKSTPPPPYKSILGGQGVQ